MSVGEISFDVTGKISQEIRVIDKTYGFDDIIHGLECGNLKTETDYEHGQHSAKRITNTDGSTVAEILSVSCNLALSNFQ